MELVMHAVTALISIETLTSVLLVDIIIDKKPLFKKLELHDILAQRFIMVLVLSVSQKLGGFSNQISSL